MLEFLGNREVYFAVWNVFDGMCTCPNGVGRRPGERDDVWVQVVGNCTSPGKHPFVLYGESGSLGFPSGHKDAVAWDRWAQVEGAVVALGGRLAVAVPDDFWVLDVDSQDAWRGLVRLFKSGALSFDDVRAVARTRRGWHVWIKMALRGWRTSTAGQTLGLSLRSVRGPEGLEVKSGGGYVVAPEGRERRWIGVHEFASAIAADASVTYGWGSASRVPRVEWRLVEGVAPEPGPLPEEQVLVGREVWDSAMVAQAGATARLELEARAARLTMVREGGRNNALNACAWFAGRQAVAAGVPYEDVASLLVGCGVAAGLGVRECVATVRSGLRGLEG